MVSLIVVDYNSIEKTLQYIQHVYENTSGLNGLNAVIVDNYSDNRNLLRDRYGNCEIRQVETWEVLIYGADFGSIAYCATGENLGYAKGNNLGTVISDELFRSDYYIVSNNDLILENRLEWENIETIFATKGDVAVIGPQIKNLKGGYQSPNRRASAFSRIVAYYFLILKPFHWNGDDDFSDESKYAYRLSGCFMIIKAEDFRRAGRFDPKTFLFAEEMILSERLNKIGKKCYFYNDFHLLHNHGESVKKNSDGLQAEIWCHESCTYYYKNYMNAGRAVLILSRISFSIFKFRKKIRSRIKRCLKK